MSPFGKLLVWVLQRLGVEGVHVFVKRQGRPARFWMFGYLNERS